MQPTNLHTSFTTTSLSKKPMFDEKRQKLLNGVGLAICKGVGFSQRQMRHNAFSLDESKLAYICGKNIIVYDLKTEIQKVFERPQDEAEVTAFSFFKTLYSQDYILYAARGGRRNVACRVGIINVWKNDRKTFSIYSLQNDQIVLDVLFLLQGAYFVLLSQHEKYRLTIFNVEFQKEARVNEVLEFQAHSLFTFDPNTEDFYTHNSKEIYRVHFDLSGVSLHKLAIELENNEKIILARGMNSHQPLLIYITDQGNLYVCKMMTDGTYSCQKEDLGTFETLDEQGNVVTRRRRPSAICCNEYNILIGYELLEQLTLVKVSGINFLKRTKQNIPFSCPYIHKMVDLNFSQENSGVSMVIQLKEGDKYGIDMRMNSEFLRQKGEQVTTIKSTQNHNLPPGKIIPVVFNFLLYRTILETYRSPLNVLLSDMVFPKSISGLAICPYKKVMIIMSQKKLIALRYDGIASTALSKLFLWQSQFSQQLVSMDMHPSNFQVAMSYRDGVKTYILEHDGLKSTNFSYNLKQCECVKYSHYGHVLAVSSPNVVAFLNPYSNELMQTIPLRHGSLKQLSFIDHDRSLYMHSTNGNIAMLRLHNNNLFELNIKSKCLTSLYDPIHDILMISYEGYTKFFKIRTKEKGSVLEFGTTCTYYHNNTAFLVCNEFNVIFIGNSLGAICCHQWPFQDSVIFSENFTSFNLHSSAITHMVMTTDLANIITGAEDGSVYISRVQHYSDGMLTTDSEIINVIRTHHRDYTMLFSLQRLNMCSIQSQSQREEKIIQLEADKADYDCDFEESLRQKRKEVQLQISKREQQHKVLKSLDTEEYSKKVQKLQQDKRKAEKQLNSIVSTSQQRKIYEASTRDNRLRLLYSENEKLQAEKKIIEDSNILELKQQADIMDAVLKQHISVQLQQQQDLDRNCENLETELMQSKIKYEQLQKEQIDEGKEYRQMVLGELEEEKNREVIRGEELRKRLNRITSEKLRYETRKKELLTITQEINSEIDELKSEKQQYEKQIRQISVVLMEKDSLINEEEKKAKEYLKNNIVETNKELFLTYRMKELEEKNKAMEAHLVNLEQRQAELYQEFLSEALTSKRVQQEMQDSKALFEQLKATLKNSQYTVYEDKYRYELLKAKVGMLMQNHVEGIEIEFQKLLQEAQKCKSTDSQLEEQAMEHQKLQQLKEKGNNLIENAHKSKKLTKTNDSIMKNILSRVNKQTISLTSQCNQLRLERNTLLQKLKEIQQKLRKAQHDYQQQQELRNSEALVEIFPPSLNISTIGKKNCKLNKDITKLPYQRYQQQNRLKRLNLMLEKNKIKKSPNKKIDILHFLRVKELEQKEQSERKTHDMSKATKPSAQDENSSFLPPINHNHNSSTMSATGLFQSSINHSIVEDCQKVLPQSIHQS